MSKYNDQQLVNAAIAIAVENLNKETKAAEKIRTALYNKQIKIAKDHALKSVKKALDKVVIIKDKTLNMDIQYSSPIGYQYRGDFTLPSTVTKVEFYDHENHRVIVVQLNVPISWSVAIVKRIKAVADEHKRCQESIDKLRNQYRQMTYRDQKTEIKSRIMAQLITEGVKGTPEKEKMDLIMKTLENIFKA